ncbi:MAG: site-2 protease family protein [Nanoarchaeota archaeon]|mgnify:CR=1 FL=1
MSFYIYDVTFLIIFSVAVGIFLYRKKHNLKREGVMYLYRTQVGIKFINYVGKKYKRTISFLAFCGIITGYILMVSMLYLLTRLVYVYLFNPEIVKAIKIPPLMPLIPYLPEAFNISFLPPFYFTYWIIAIAVIALFHEFAHGIVARRYNVKIVTTGFGFLGPFLAAFVEPNEKQMVKKTKYQQIAILSAGVFTNTLLALFFFVLLSVFFLVAYTPSGAVFNTYTLGAVPLSSVTMIGGKMITVHSTENILQIIEKNNLTDDLILGGNGKSLTLTEITADDKNYYIAIENLALQLKENRANVILYEDLPAIRAGLRGSIVKIDNTPVKDYEDLVTALKQYKAGDDVVIETIDRIESEKKLVYNLRLIQNTDDGKAVIGIGYLGNSESVLTKMTDMFNFFKKPATDYQPRYNGDFILFIYHLIWWLAVINLSVALVNMWPVGIFDGGKMFMLTVWAITGSETFAQTAFKVATYIILGSLVILMISWGFAIF